MDSPVDQQPHYPDFERHGVRFDKHDPKLRKRKKPRGKPDRDQMPISEDKQ